MPSPLGGDFFFGEGKIVVGSDISKIIFEIAKKKKKCTYIERKWVKKILAFLSIHVADDSCFLKEKIFMIYHSFIFSSITLSPHFSLSTFFIFLPISLIFIRSAPFWDVHASSLLYRKIQFFYFILTNGCLRIIKFRKIIFYTTFL